MSQTDCILFVIDAHARMAQPANGGPSPFAQALRAIVKTMQDRILSGDRDLVGVLLYGTEETKVPNDHQGFPHIFMLQDLEIPSAGAISALNLLLERDGPPPFGHMQARRAPCRRPTARAATPRDVLPLSRPPARQTPPA